MSVFDLFKMWLNSLKVCWHQVHIERSLLRASALAFIFPATRRASTYKSKFQLERNNSSSHFRVSKFFVVPLFMKATMQALSLSNKTLHPDNGRTQTKKEIHAEMSFEKNYVFEKDLTVGEITKLGKNSRLGVFPIPAPISAKLASVVKLTEERVQPQTHIARRYKFISLVSSAKKLVAKPSGDSCEDQ